MAEKRKFDLVICVKINAKAAFKIELFDASQWSESAQGRYRLRINRRWHNAPDGKHIYLDMVQVVALVGSLAQGKGLSLDPAPNIPRGTPVSVANGGSHCGIAWRDVTHTATPTIQGYDGRWYVGVVVYGQGCVFVPVSDLIILPRRDGGKRRVKGA